MTECRAPSVLPSAGMYSIDVIADRAGAAGIAQEWSDLVDRSPAPSVFLTPQFLGAWWSAYGSALAMHLVVVRHEETLVGLAPLALGPRTDGRRGLAILGRLSRC